MMADDANFEAEQAHRHFSASCFNLAWELIEKPDRTAEDDEQMVRLAQASLWHWTQRSDRTDKNLSIGYWQVSRVYALLGKADSSRQYAQLCLDKTSAAEPFFRGYAYEAFARAESIAGNDEKAAEYLKQARGYAEEVTDLDDKQLLVDDLKTLE
jgi:hypothetical protein